MTGMSDGLLAVGRLQGKNGYRQRIMCYTDDSGNGR